MNRHARLERDKRKFKQKLDNLYWKKDKQWYLWFQDHEDEIFKEIPGTIGLYFISNYGKVVSFHRPDPLQLSPRDKYKSLVVSLSLPGVNKGRSIKSLVYQCFCGPLPYGGEVEHINGNHRDNHYKNLRLRRPKTKAAQSKNREVNRLKEVLQFSLAGQFLKKHPSIAAAARAASLADQSIRVCLKNKKHISGGYQWYLSDDPIFKDGIKNIARAKPSQREVLQFTVQGKFLRSFNSITQAVEATKISRGAVKKNLAGDAPTAGEFQFRRPSDPAFTLGIKDIPGVKPLPEAAKGNKLTPPPVAVVKFDLHGRFIAEYPSLGRAAATIKGSGATAINKCLKGRGYTAGGFLWRRRDDPRFKKGITNIEPLSGQQFLSRAEIFQFDLKGKFIERYPNARAAAGALKCKVANIVNAVIGKNRHCSGFQWRSSLDPRFKDGVADIAPVPAKTTRRYRAVVKFTRTGRKAAEYPSIQAARRAEGVAYLTIVNYIEGRVPITSEFYWEFKLNHPKHMAPPWVIPPPPRKPSAACKKVLQFSLGGRFLKSYPSITAAARASGASVSGISSCARKKDNTSGGFLWYFRSDPLFQNKIRNVPPVQPAAQLKTKKNKTNKTNKSNKTNKKTMKSSGKELLQFSLEGKFIRSFRFRKEAMRAAGITPGVLGPHLRGEKKHAGGFQFRCRTDAAFRDGICDIPAVKIEIKPYPNHLGVCQFDLSGRFIAEYPSITAAVRSFPDGMKSLFQLLREKKEPIVRGFFWVRRDDPRFRSGITGIEPVPYKVKSKPIKFLLFSREGKYLRAFSTKTELLRTLRASHKNLDKHLQGKTNTLKGYQVRLASSPLFKDGIRDIPAVEPDPVVIPNTKRVLKFDIYGRFITEYPSISTAAADNGRSCSGLSGCLTNAGTLLAGFQWRYRDDPRFRDGITAISPIYKEGGPLPANMPVLQFDLQGKFLRQYPLIATAARALGINPVSILTVIGKSHRTCGGFQWRTIADPFFKDGTKNIPPLKKRPLYNALIVLKFDRGGRLVEKFPSIEAAAAGHGVSHMVMKRFLRGIIPVDSKYYWTVKDKHPKFISSPEPQPGENEPAPLPRGLTIIDKEILQFDLKGKFLRKFPDNSAAAKAVGGKAWHLSNYFRKNSSQCLGYIWRAASDPLFKDGIIDLPLSLIPSWKLSRPVLKFNKEGRLVDMFHAVDEAARDQGISNFRMARLIEGHLPENSEYYWKYKDQFSPEQLDKLTGPFFRGKLELEEE